MELYSPTQPSPGWPGLHQDPRPLVQLTTVLEKQLAKVDCITLTVKFDSAVIKLCACVKKSSFLSWAIRPVFARPPPIMLE